ncbi:hypothetical protein IAE16_09630 [Hydrogenobacter sp. T-2]|uniref:hypothetical protein n=1 Tax=Pampinifervens diazotrophicum TaxID=1632018 RepID=UPI002B25868B|nr:hypothetical protein [Hydrogenobacter sp. T-2]WPM32066.1 hypothetical protein IAE16_09630 [Hydrogenobacter sp. T-2]
MRDYKQLISGFLYGGVKEENYMKKLIRSSLSQYMDALLRRKFGDDYEEEVLSELRLRLINNKDYLQRLEYINLHYLKTLIRNFLVDIINGERIEVYSLQKQVFEEEEAKPVVYEDKLRDTRHHFAEVEGSTLFEALMKNLKDGDMVVLCYYFYKYLYNSEIELRDISKDNIYKRWERLRKGKLKEILGDASPEEIRAMVERFLSEVCQKRGYICNERGDVP